MGWASLSQLQRNLSAGRQDYPTSTLAATRPSFSFSLTAWVRRDAVLDTLQRPQKQTISCSRCLSSLPLPDSTRCLPCTPCSPSSTGWSSASPVKPAYISRQPTPPPPPPPPPSSYECHEQEITELGLRFEAQILHQHLEPAIAASSAASVVVGRRESDDRRTPPSAAATVYLQPSAVQNTNESESAGTAA